MLLQSTPVRNRLLAHLPPAAFAELRPHLRRVHLQRRQVLQEINAPVGSVYFPECGVALLLARSRCGRQVGVWVVGRLGLVGVPAVLGTMYAPNAAPVVHIPWANRRPGGNRRGPDACGSRCGNAGEASARAKGRRKGVGNPGRPMNLVARR
jgi:CRP-like cAMP-binding protein